MPPLILELLTQAFACSLVVIVCATVARPSNWWLLASFVLYIAADGFIQAAMPTWLHARVGHWNWTGKILSILLSLAVAKSFGLDRREVGLIPPHGRRGWAWTWSGVLAATLFAILVNYGFRDHVRPTAETLAFQATLPGIDEELAFRGVGVALLTRGYSGPLRSWLGVVVTTLVFGFAHALYVSHGRLQLSYLPLFYVLPVGLLFGVVRLKSGSLFGTLLAHNLSNTMGQLASSLP